MNDKHTDKKREEDVENTPKRHETAKKAPISPPDAADDTETVEPTGQDLRYNEEAASFEFEPELGEGEYKHHDPYNTAVSGAGDHMSTYDEANPFTPDEYSDKSDGMNDD